jgi:lipid A 3-O-deacylase
MKFINNLLKICSIFIFFTIQNVSSEENKIFEKDHEWNFYSGIFDFSDDGKRASLFGIQHQNENLVRDSFLGTLSPVTGFMMTADNATYDYTGVQAQYKIGKLNIIPSFTPGIYGEGDGKDLGHMVEFKSEVQLSLDIFSNSELGFSYNHISNASLGDKNPGANSYMFNFLKKF